MLSLREEGRKDEQIIKVMLEGGRPYYEECGKSWIIEQEMKKKRIVMMKMK